MKFAHVAMRIALAGSAVLAMSACGSSEPTGPLAQYTGEEGMEFVAQCYYDYGQISDYFASKLADDAAHIGVPLQATDKYEFERMKKLYGDKREIYKPRLKELAAEQGFENFFISAEWSKNMVPYFTTDVPAATGETHPSAGGEPIRFWTKFGDMVDYRCAKAAKPAP